MFDLPPLLHKRDVFVIMPFSTTKSCSENEWTEIYEDVFQPAIENCGLQCGRAEVGTGNLIKSIIERLRNAYIVLADITDANPNVFYELGVTAFSQQKNYPAGTRSKAHPVGSSGLLVTHLRNFPEKSRNVQI